MLGERRQRQRAARHEAAHAVTMTLLSEKDPGVESPGTGVTDSYELLFECWELNLGPLEEQQMLVAAKPPLQPTNSVSSLLQLASSSAPSRTLMSSQINFYREPSRPRRTFIRQWMEIETEPTLEHCTELPGSR
ncbi:hypothetical protein LEMLEM_LOCUS4978 [Lemmus lemmus]